MTTLYQHENIASEGQRGEVALGLEKNARVAVGTILAYWVADLCFLSYWA